MQVRKLTVSALIALFCVAIFAGGVQAAELYNADGFDSPTFTTGALPGQDTPVWNGSAPATTTATVIDSALAPAGASGDQSLEVVRGSNTDPVAGESEFGEWWVDLSSAGAPTPTQQQVIIDWSMNVPASGSQTAFGPMFGVYANNVTNLGVSRLGGMFVDAQDGSVLVTDAEPVVLSGTQVTLGEWHDFRMILDFSAAQGSEQQVQMFIDGAATPFYTDDFSFSATGDVSAFTDAAIFTSFANPDDASLNQGGTAYFDNYVVTLVPEPASLALLAIGGILLVRRR